VRIAQVAPLYESVPPRLYGGTERVVSFLTEELVEDGAEVTLFASGDSITTAKLVSVWDCALRLDRRAPEPTSLHVLMLEEVYQRAGEFDVIHFHIDAVQLPVARRIGVPCVMTMHGRLDIAGLPMLYREYSDLSFVAVSDSQRRQLPEANWVATIHHGIPSGLITPSDSPGDYLAFLGRISPEKRVDRAIEIANRSGIPLKIAAKVDRVDREYFDDEIAPLIDGSFIQFVGEVDDHGKAMFLRNALALLFPIDWPEPFGLVMIEAMAAGTPVIAFEGGSVAEVVDEGVTGCVVSTIEEAVRSVQRMPLWDRKRCRSVFEERFTARRMAQDYRRVYERLARPAARIACRQIG
jgi:glycosyltransferase involved in cell wall biosynthesis